MSGKKTRTRKGAAKAGAGAGGEGESHAFMAVLWGRREPAPVSLSIACFPGCCTPPAACGGASVPPTAVWGSGTGVPSGAAAVHGCRPHARLSSGDACWLPAYAPFFVRPPCSCRQCLSPLPLHCTPLTVTAQLWRAPLVAAAPWGSRPLYAFGSLCLFHSCPRPPLGVSRLCPRAPPPFLALFAVRDTDVRVVLRCRPLNELELSKAAESTCIKVGT